MTDIFEKVAAMHKLKSTGNFIAVTGELLGLLLAILFLYENAGTSGVVLGIVFFPFTWAYLPLYKLFALHSWDLFLTNYGSLAIALLFYLIADNTTEEASSATEEPPTHPVMTKTLKDYIAPAFILLVISGLILAALVTFLK